MMCTYMHITYICIYIYIYSDVEGHVHASRVRVGCVRVARGACRRAQGTSSEDFGLGNRILQNLGKMRHCTPVSPLRTSTSQDLVLVHDHREAAGLQDLGTSGGGGGGGGGRSSSGSSSSCSSGGSSSCSGGGGGGRGSAGRQGGIRTGRRRRRRSRSRARRSRGSSRRSKGEQEERSIRASPSIQSSEATR